MDWRLDGDGNTYLLDGHSTHTHNYYGVRRVGRVWQARPTQAGATQKRDWTSGQASKAQARGVVYLESNAHSTLVPCGREWGQEGTGGDRRGAGGERVRERRRRGQERCNEGGKPEHISGRARAKESTR